jgi:hypothetical protein
LEDSSIKHNGFSSTGNLNSNLQTVNRIYDQKDQTIRRDNSLHYRSQPSGNLERSYLEDSRAGGTTSSQILRNDRYYPSNQNPLLKQPSYRRETAPILSDRR